MLLVFFAGITGYYPVFRILQYRVRQEIKQRIKRGIRDEQLHAITSEHEQELEWLRPGKEFRYKDNLYDIVYTRHSDGRVVYYCINDTEEKALFASLDDMVKQEMNGKNNKHGSTAKSLLKNFFKLYSNTRELLTVHYTPVTVTFSYLFQYTAPSRELSTPPPEYC